LSSEEEESSLSDDSEELKAPPAKRFKNGHLTDTGNYVFDPPKALAGVVGYDKVLHRVCIIHVGKTLSCPGVTDDLLRTFPGTPSE
jgi:hypothetical protein